jgi:predicted glutamine amidotransferase
MQLGFNENVIHNGVMYHAQTEDGGKKNPVITTLLFKEGSIISSKRTSYADIIKSDKLQVVVKEIMRDQHGTMLKNLKDGVFDKKEEKVEPQVKGAEKVEEKKGAPLVSEKSLDDVILEYLSLSDKE